MGRITQPPPPRCWRHRNSRRGREREISWYKCAGRDLALGCLGPSHVPQCVSLPCLPAWVALSDSPRLARVWLRVWLAHTRVCARCAVVWVRDELHFRGRGGGGGAHRTAHWGGRNRWYKLSMLKRAFWRAEILLHSKLIPMSLLEFNFWASILTFTCSKGQK